MSASNLFIGIDSGTQGTKALVLDQDGGTILAQSYAAHELTEKDTGLREQDPAWWIAACDRVLSEVLSAQEVDPAGVRALGVSGQQHGFVPLDAAGRVIRPAKLWCDTETAPQCEAITRAVGGPQRVVSLIGNSVAAGFTASKVLWLKENEPDNYDRLATILLPHDYINYWLTGELATECGDASGTAYFDVAGRKWNGEILRAMDPSGKLESCLPRLVDSVEPVGTIRAEIAEKFGLNRDVLVSSGGGDNMMAAIGTGNVRPGVVTASLGTSGTIYAYSDIPVIDPRGELAAFCSSSGGWLPLVCTMNVTVATEAARNLLELDVEELNVLAGSAPVGSGGVTLIPFFNGERTPALPRATASLHGLTTGNCTRENLCRASMEGATMGLRYGLDVLREQGVDPTQIRLVGGGAKSALWRAMAADVFDCPVVTPQTTEAGAMGGALQAMWCFMNESERGANLEEITARYVVLAPERMDPDPERTRAYSEVYEGYLELCDKLYS